MNMAIANRKAVYQCDVETVWNIVTSLKEYAWRSDLSKIEVKDEKQFVEYTTDGYATTFTITATEPCKRWEFDMENDNMKGHWTGLFTEQDGKTALDFTEDVTPKRWILNLFIKGYLKKQQRQYLADLEKAVEQAKRV